MKLRRRASLNTLVAASTVSAAVKMLPVCCLKCCQSLWLGCVCVKKQVQIDSIRDIFCDILFWYCFCLGLGYFLKGCFFNEGIFNIFRIHWGQLWMSRLCGFSLLRLWLHARGVFSGKTGMSCQNMCKIENQRKHPFVCIARRGVPSRVRGDVSGGYLMEKKILLNSEIHIYIYIQGINIRRYTKNHFV